MRHVCHANLLCCCACSCAARGVGPAGCERGRTSMQDVATARSTLQRLDALLDVGYSAAAPLRHDSAAAAAAAQPGSLCVSGSLQTCRSSSWAGAAASGSDSECIFLGGGSQVGMFAWRQL